MSIPGEWMYQRKGVGVYLEAGYTRGDRCTKGGGYSRGGIPESRGGYTRGQGMQVGMYTHPSQDIGPWIPIPQY